VFRAALSLYQVPRPQPEALVSRSGAGRGILLHLFECLLSTADIRLHYRRHSGNLGRALALLSFVRPQLVDNVWLALLPRVFFSNRREKLIELHFCEKTSICHDSFDRLRVCDVEKRITLQQYQICSLSH
jgi:hypothetical protein